MDADRVARTFGLGGDARLSEGPVARGRQGAVWRLETESGRFAVKVPGANAAAADHALATAFHEAAHSAGVPTPRVHRTTDGRVWADVDGIRLRVDEWVDLRPPDISLDPELVGATVSAIHRVADPEPHPSDVSAWYVEPVGAPAWDDLLDRLGRAHAPFADDLGALRDDLVALDTWVVPPRRVRTCHRDLWADNLRGTADGGVCVFDWENTGPADPAYELACVVFEFGRGDRRRARALVDAYVAAGGPARITGRDDFSMLIAQLGHIVSYAAEGWLWATDESERAEAEEWVRELVDDPHTPPLLDALLAEVTT